MGVFGWERLITHNHSLEVTLGGAKIHVCARCSGAVLGVSFALVLSALLGASFAGTPFAQMFLPCVALAMPASVDWITQSWGLRESNNRLRTCTGLLEGAGVALLSLTAASTLAKAGAILSVGGTVVCLGLLGRRLRTQAP